MLVIKYLLLIGAVATLVIAAAMLLIDLYFQFEYRRRLALHPDLPLPLPRPLRLRQAVRLGVLSLVPLMLAFSIVVVPSGMAGVRVSQLSGTLPGTLYPGFHAVVPLVQHAVMYDVRDKVYATFTNAPALKKGEVAEPRPEALTVQAKEGLPIGLAITVRYRLDAEKLSYIHNTLPEPIDTEIVQPTIGSAFRSLAPQYTVRDVFAEHREELRSRAADEITSKLGADGIIVKEVMLRNVQLPPEYAKGLEGSAAEGAGKRPDERAD